jgi:hypothetical protein
VSKGAEAPRLPVGGPSQKLAQEAEPTGLGTLLALAVWQPRLHVDFPGLSACIHSLVPLLIPSPHSPEPKRWSVPAWTGKASLRVCTLLRPASAPTAGHWLEMSPGCGRGGQKGGCSQLPPAGWGHLPCALGRQLGHLLSTLPGSAALGPDL